MKEFIIVRDIKLRSWNYAIIRGRKKLRRDRKAVSSKCLMHLIMNERRKKIKIKLIRSENDK